MTRITHNQVRTILSLFKGGATMENLATSYGVPLSRIEEIIRAYVAPEGKL